MTVFEFKLRRFNICKSSLHTVLIQYNQHWVKVNHCYWVNITRYCISAISNSQWVNF